MTTIGKSARPGMLALAMLLTVGFALPGPAAAVYVYPAKGQSDEQMDKDKGECHQWAVRESGWDPVNGTVVSQDEGPGVLGGAAGGAALGAIGGAIAGSPGTGAAIGAAVGGLFGGMKSSSARREQESRRQAYDASYRKALTACLEGRGYTVS